MAVEQLLSVEQLAAVLHKSPASIRSDASRNPSALPPICRLPGTKRLLWRQHDVEAWLARFAILGVQQATATQAASQAAPTRRRGRPTKKEQVARERLRVTASSPAHAAAIRVPGLARTAALNATAGRAQEFTQ